MPKLNQIVAVVAGKKTRTEKEFGELNKVVQKPDLFVGLSRTYQPAEENGETLPPEQKFPQKSAGEIIATVREILTGVMDAVATQEFGNCRTAADVKVDGRVILPAVPVTVLLYLERQLNDMRTFVGNLPVLDPSERWVMNGQTGEYTTEPTRTIRTRKVQKPIVLYPATEQHPAQTQLVTEDVTAGYWTTTKYAAVLSAAERRDILARIDRLSEAAKIAREEANGLDVEQVQIAGPVLNFVFGK